MHGVKVIAFLCFTISAVALVQSAPQPFRTDELQKKIADFLEHDKELPALLQKYSFGEAPALSRHVRQVNAVETIDEPEGEEPNKNGFFDRAAKFVMEVLQRFLKWINTDN